MSALPHSVFWLLNGFLVLFSPLYDASALLAFGGSTGKFNERKQHMNFDVDRVLAALAELYRREYGVEVVWRERDARII